MFYKLTSGEVGRFQLLELEKCLEAELWSRQRTQDSAAGNTDAARELRLQLTPGSCSLLRVSATIPSAPLCPTVDIKDQRLLVSVLDLHTIWGKDKQSTRSQPVSTASCKRWAATWGPVS